MAEGAILSALPEKTNPTLLDMFYLVEAGGGIGKERHVKLQALLIPLKADQATAAAGTSDDRVITPLRLVQALAARGFVKNNIDATTAPATGNDSTQGYDEGSLWVDTVANRAWICMDPAAGAATWIEILDIATKAMAEAATNNNRAMTPLRVAEFFANRGFAKNNQTATADPAATDDSSKGYGVGSIWVNTAASPRTAFICTNAGVGAAQWKAVGSGEGSGGGSVTYATKAEAEAGTRSDVAMSPLRVVEALAARGFVRNRVDPSNNPGAIHDRNAGYGEGSIWVNLGTGAAFVCVDAADAAALWTQIGGFDELPVTPKTLVGVKTGGTQFEALSPPTAAKFWRPVSKVSGGAVTLNTDQYLDYEIDCNANVTLSFAGTVPTDAALVVNVTLKNTNGRTLTPPAGVLKDGGSAVTLSPGATDVDLVSFYWNGANWFMTVVQQDATA